MANIKYLEYREKQKSPLPGREKLALLAKGYGFVMYRIWVDSCKIWSAPWTMSIKEWESLPIWKD